MSAVESWFAPAVVAEPLPRQRPQRRAPARPRPKAQQAERRSFKIRASLVWMVVLAGLLVGVVAVNVAVLRANVSVNDLDTKIAQLRWENSNLTAEYSKATAAAGVRAGYVLASGDAKSYLDLGRRK